MDERHHDDGGHLERERIADVTSPPVDPGVRLSRTRRGMRRMTLVVGITACLVIAGGATMGAVWAKGSQRDSADSPATTQAGEPAQADKDAAVTRATHTLQVAIQCWAVDHNDLYPDPAEVTSKQDALGVYIDDWPVNPFTGAPMAAGDGPGGFTYTVSEDGRSYTLTTHLRAGDAVVAVSNQTPLVSRSDETTSAAPAVEQTQAEKDAAVKQGIHTLQIALQSCAIDHSDICLTPEQLANGQDILGTYVDDWPANPYTGQPMALGSERGDFSYTVSDDYRSFTLTGHLNGAGGEYSVSYPSR